MTTKNKYLDKMLEKLDGYQAPAEPDWDAFYQKNKGRIPVKESKGIVSKSFVRTSLIVIAILAVFMGGYYFMQPSTSADENVNSEQNTTKTTNENVSIDDKHTDEPADQLENQSIIILPQTESSEVIDKPGGIEEIIANPNAMFEQTDIQTSNQPVDNIIIDEPKVTVVPSKSDSAIEKPVIIKKTVVIKDTIRVKKPMKKEK